MRLIVKSIKQIPHNIEVENDLTTIKDLKIEIEKVHGYDHALIKLINEGIILEDYKSLANYDIKEDTVIIITNSRPKAGFVKPNDQPQEQFAKPIPVLVIKEEPNEKETPSNVPDEMPVEVQKIEEKQEVQPIIKQDNILIHSQIPFTSDIEIQPQILFRPQLQKDYSKEVNNLIEMGFNKDKAEEALQTSKGNLDLALDFLCNDIKKTQMHCLIY